MKRSDLHLNYALVEEIVVTFLRNEIRKFGFDSAVLGLSGGIDSAVVCELAARALGPENVHAVLMPYRTSSSESLDHARLMVEKTGVTSEVCDISGVVDAFFRGSEDASRLRRGNVMARARMLYLYDISARDGRLVIGTSNKTELLLGYGTLFGDMASAVNPIGDLYKTQLWGLADFLGIPEELVTKAPSADLWEGQSDEEDLGFTYAGVDQLLYMMLERRMGREEIVGEGIDGEFYDRVRRMVVRNQYKRMMPVIAKLSSRTPGIDFRYARDWQEMV
ncbi:NAD+ synthase [Prosthecochloris sp. N3]|uniref:NH(3)-dependent NAD(+) synthetase n=1 Tax=Prosthecochloris ethylica TaxID=2743976 RepID=A0ABR9XRI5_9CHLB|nr:NAD+ synthase [Prosthecochloris ethylica]MBF0586727.1 NAD+ synthase [Prosthecochloris ethylica]MBF0636633.1 NAD+ synthase [Prosthecochloris ethylica]MEC9487447.1 NAD+ synthase [Prosthecochloris sp.]NUK47968.1 NAD+ synthase [Prosthecochloris ethylica]